MKYELSSIAFVNSCAILNDAKRKLKDKILIIVTNYLLRFIFFVVPPDPRLLPTFCFIPPEKMESKCKRSKEYNELPKIFIIVEKINSHNDEDPFCDTEPKGL